MSELPPLGRVCRKCLGEDASAAAHLDEYVASLPDSVRASPEAYAARLALCGDCPRRIGILCSVCGCYIQARAAKRKMECPIDFGPPRWRAEPDQS